MGPEKNYLVDPKLDITFKNLFGVESNKDLMIDFLNSILELKGNDKIKNITFLNNEIIPVLAKNSIKNKNKKHKNKSEDENKNENENSNNNNNNNNNNKEVEGGRMDILVNPLKYEDSKANPYFLRSTNNNSKRRKTSQIYDESKIEIKAETEKKQLINIVIQVQDKGHMGKRSIYYASGIIFQSLPKTAPYDELPELIMINILNYNFINGNSIHIKFEDDDEEYKNLLNERCHSIYNIREVNSNRKEIFENTLTIHFIELKKFTMEVNKEKLNSDKYRWIKFLLYPEQFRESQSKLFIKAVDTLEALGTDNNFLILYEQKQKEDKDYLSSMSSQQLQGEIEGEKYATIKYLLLMLNYKKQVKKIKDKINLPENDINYICNFYQNKNRNISILASKLKYKEEKLKEICNSLEISFIENKK